MDDHFRAFSFVDRIASLEPGGSVRGCYSIPAAVARFPVSLVAEAVGQLAAWAAMAAVGFTHRPVAGIAGGVDLLSEVCPGQVLELSAELQEVDRETVGYSGTARAGGIPILRLHDCVGPMLKAEEFDNPQSLRDRFALLRDSGAAPGAFPGMPTLEPERDGGEPGRSARAILRVPAKARFFLDHFPRRPVFPGTLLMQACLETAAMIGAEVCAGGRAAWRPRLVSDVKLRAFILPGETLSLEARPTERCESSLNVAVATRLGQRVIGSAEVRLVPGEAP